MKNVYRNYSLELIEIEIHTVRCDENEFEFEMELSSKLSSKLN